MIKKVLFLLLFLIILIPSFAIEEDNIQSGRYTKSIPNKNIVELNIDEDDVIEFRKVKRVTITKNSLKLNKQKKNNVYDKLLYEDVNHLKLKEQSVSKAVQKEIFDNTFLGTKYKTTVDDGYKKDTFSLFSQYKKDKFSFVSSLDSKKSLFKKGRKKHSFSFSPQYEFNKHLSIKNINSNNFYNKERKSEIVLSLTPFDDDRFDFNIGAGKIYRHDRKHQNSQLNFSTQFRF